MKILVVSNLYPPHYQGGYELRCSQVTEFLRRRGHEVRVVASDYLIEGETHTTLVREDTHNGVPVSRFLRQHRLDMREGSGRLHNLDIVRRQISDATRFREILDEFKPDLVAWWNLEGVLKSIIRMPHDRGIPAVYLVDDNWMIREFGAAGDADLPFWLDFWRVRWGPKPLRPLVRMALASTERRFEREGIPTKRFTFPPGHVCFISEFWRYLHVQAGLDVTSSDVIYGGVSPERFYARRTPADYASGPLRLLYAGYIDQRRGLHTIVEALALVPPSQRARMHLSVAHAGPAVPDEYVNSITERIERFGLSSTVTFLGRLSHDQMPAVYAAHDVLVFASTRNEGMPMVMMEAMCAGCAVPNTGSGGAIELSDRAGTPIFPKDHPLALSRMLSALEKDRLWVADVALRGQQTVLRDFTIDRMLEKTCDVFERVASRRFDSHLAAASV
jgi:glycosyltransferase involved in cell wall biosynthesis